MEYVPGLEVGTITYHHLNIALNRNLSSSELCTQGLFFSWNGSDLSKLMWQFTHMWCWLSLSYLFQESFYIDSDDGQVHIQNKLSYEHVSEMDFAVQVQDVFAETTLVQTATGIPNNLFTRCRYLLKIILGWICRHSGKGVKTSNTRYMFQQYWSVAYSDCLFYFILVVWRQNKWNKFLPTLWSDSFYGKAH